MHTTNIGDTTFSHNGDYDGIVEVRRLGGILSIPFEDLKEFVAEHVRTKRIGKMEDATTDEILGI